MALRGILGMVVSVAVTVVSPHGVAADDGFGLPTMRSAGLEPHAIIFSMRGPNAAFIRLHNHFFLHHAFFKRHRVFFETPFLFFDDGPFFDEVSFIVPPGFVGASPSSSPDPSPRVCPAGPPGPTFSTETTEGVRIVRGHIDRC